MGLARLASPSLSPSMPQSMSGPLPLRHPRLLLGQLQAAFGYRFLLGSCRPAWHQDVALWCGPPPGVGLVASLLWAADHSSEPPESWSSLTVPDCYLLVSPGNLGILKYFTQCAQLFKGKVLNVSSLSKTKSQRLPTKMKPEFHVGHLWVNL